MSVLSELQTIFDVYNVLDSDAHAPFSLTPFSLFVCVMDGTGTQRGHCFQRNRNGQINQIALDTSHAGVGARWTSLRLGYTSRTTHLDTEDCNFVTQCAVTLSSVSKHECLCFSCD